MLSTLSHLLLGALKISIIKSDFMKLFLIGNRPNVLQRWSEILQESQPQVLPVSELTAGRVSKGDMVIIHLSSIAPSSYNDIFRFKAENPSVLLIVATDVPEENEGLKALQAGANAYINAFITQSLFFEVLKTIKNGDIWAGPELLQKLLKMLLTNSQPESEPLALEIENDLFKDLSAREKDVLSVLVTGVSNKEIARSLDITERTVKAHLSSIFQKTGAVDRISLILMANKS